MYESKKKAQVLTKPEDILREGNLQQVKQMFEAADKNGETIRFDDKHTAVHYASINQDSTVLLYLLKELHLNPDAIDGFKMAPLDYAVRRGYVEHIKILIDHGADFERKNVYGLFLIDTLDKYKHHEKVGLVKEIIEAAKQRKQQAGSTQMCNSDPIVSKRRTSYSSIESDGVTADTMSSNSNVSPSSSSSLSNFFKSVGNYLGYSSNSSSEKKLLLASSVESDSEEESSVASISNKIKID